jgi:hypothetical protein
MGMEYIYGRVLLAASIQASMGVFRCSGNLLDEAGARKRMVAVFGWLARTPCGRNIQRILYRDGRRRR